MSKFAIYFAGNFRYDLVFLPPKKDIQSQEVGIKIQGAYHYLRHPRQDIYLAAIYGRDFSFCGDPAKAGT